MKRHPALFLIALAVGCTVALPQKRIVRSGTPIDPGLVTQIVSSGCSSTALQGILDANGSFFPLGSTGIGTRSNQADTDLCNRSLPEKDGAALPILREVFGNVVTDSVHSLSGPYGGHLSYSGSASD